MRRPVTTLAASLAMATVLAACSTGPPDDGAAPSGTVPNGFATVKTDVGSVARPDAWRPTDRELDRDSVASFDIGDDEVLGQMDVLVNEVPPGTEAEALNAATQGARALDLADLRHERRESIEVPGAASAHANESTYTTDQGPARSLDLLAIGAGGEMLLVRISALESAYDAGIASAVEASMRLE